MTSYTALSNGSANGGIKLSNGHLQHKPGTMRKETKENLVVAGLCVLWYIVSSTNNVIGKMVFNTFPYPTTVTMVQLLSITVYSGPFFRLWGIRPRADIPRKYYMRLIVPLAIGKFLASVTSHISIWKVPVSYAHTVKGTMPLFTVILSQLILKERHTKWVYLSLLPIVAGVVIASFTEISFDLTGLICALLSTVGFSLQNIFSKKVLKDTDMHHLRLLYMLGRLALFMFLPVWFFVDFKVVTQPSLLFSGSYRTPMLLLADGILNWLQNIIAFSVISMVTPLTYSVASAIKRIFVIGVSLFILGNPVTGLNILGMMLTIIGVFAYNRAKAFARKSGKYELLPTTNKGVANGGNSRGMLLDEQKSDKIMNLLLAQNGMEPQLPKVAQGGYNNNDSRSSNFNSSRPSNGVATGNGTYMWNSAANKMMFV